MKTILINLLKKAFDKVNNLLPEDDKLGHSYIGDWVCLISIILITIFIQLKYHTLNVELTVVLSLLITIAVAFFREWYNKVIEEKQWSWWDIFFTVIRPLIITILILFKII